MELISDRWSDATRRFLEWIGARRADRRLVILHDSDADGVSAAVVARRSLATRGFTDIRLLAPDRFRDAWTPSNRASTAAEAPDSLLVLDLGSRAEPIAPGVPTCIIDHHRPEGTPPDGILISGYGWDPTPNTSLLVRECMRSLDDAEPLDWIAAVGVLSDLGDRAPFDLLSSVRERWPMAALREITSLVNAARRGSTHQPEVAVRLLELDDDPRAIVRGDGEELRTLREARAEVKRELDQGKKSAPLFAGNIALVRVSSPCQIHPVIAQIWRTRLPRYVVMVSNDAYLPGRVNFSMRTASDVNLLDLLGATDLGEGEGSYGRGHDKATGGSLPPDRWKRLLERLGFPPDLSLH